jgi:LPXTG-motif cell wall-anchored protein
MSKDSGRWVTATGTEPLTYQWQKRTGTNASWEDITGAVNSEHTTSQANISNSGFAYRVIVTDAYGRSVTSDAATLTVTKAPEPPETGDHSQPMLYMALIILFMLSTVLLLGKRKKV